MRPPQYNDDRWEDPRKAESMAADAVNRGPGDNGEERSERDIEELLNRPDEREERVYECNDTTPINYAKGPHDEEFGVDDKEFDGPDRDPMPYHRGPADEEEFGVEEDDDELEPLDD